jgi:hypothetical protein
MFLKFIKTEKVKIINLWAFHIIIFSILCATIEHFIDPHSFYFRRSLDGKFLEQILFSPFAGLLGHWDRFPFFIFFVVLLFLVITYFTRNIFYNYIVSLLCSYLLLGIFTFTKDKIFYYLIPSLIITIILNIFVFKPFKRKNTS